MKFRLNAYLQAARLEHGAFVRVQQIVGDIQVLDENVERVEVVDAPDLVVGEDERLKARIQHDRHDRVAAERAVVGEVDAFALEHRAAGRIGLDGAEQQQQQSAADAQPDGRLQTRHVWPSTHGWPHCHRTAKSSKASQQQIGESFTFDFVRLTNTRRTHRTHRAQFALAYSPSSVSLVHFGEAFFGVKSLNAENRRCTPTT